MSRVIISNCVIGCDAKSNLRIVEYAQGRKHFCPVCGEECLAVTVGKKNEEFEIKYLGKEQWTISRFSEFAEAWGRV